MFWSSLAAALAIAVAAPSSVINDVMENTANKFALSRSKRSETCEGSTATASTSQAEINELLVAHNSARGNVSPTSSNMNALEWNSELADLAQWSANQCIYAHGNKIACNGDGVGQNIHITTASLNLAGAVSSWDSEKAFYSYSGNSCQTNKTCGHHTQVVWAKSMQVGCAHKVCPSIQVNGATWTNAALTFCNYGPKGNMNGGSPYKTGTACTACVTPNGRHCDANGLCVNCIPSSTSLPSCACDRECLNGGALDAGQCTCSCPESHYGPTCALSCSDASPGCPDWTAFGFCTEPSIEAFMKNTCPKSCKYC